MEGSKSRKRDTAVLATNEDCNNTFGLQILLDVIRNLSPDQVTIIKSIGFGSLLHLSCSYMPHEVFNWLATHMDTEAASIDFPNGYSFIITAECVQLILDIPLGHQPISFCSSTETVQRVNMEIHGKEYTPSVHELVVLIRNGLSGSSFAKAFMLLANCLLLCATNEGLPSSIYYEAISDMDRITDLNWCSFVLQWLLLSIHKYQLNAKRENCGGCGLIPVIAYFEFLIVAEVHLGISIPRLPLWTDNLLKLYSILDSKEDSSFGKLKMKHLCSTPFAHTNQKCNATYDLSVDVVRFIESSYSSDEQIHVKKKLKILSSNLHKTILTNTTRAISNCVDEVLRALCTEHSSIPRDPTVLINEGTIQCDNLLYESNVLGSANKSKGNAETEGKTVFIKDASTSTRELLRDSINYYMDRAFPPLPVPEIEDPDPSDLFCSSEVFTALIHTLSSKALEQESLGITSVDDYLSKTLVTKLEITTYDNPYEQMSILDMCKLDLTPPKSEPPLMEEKVDLIGLFDCSQRRKRQDISEVDNSEQKLPETSNYCVSGFLTPKQISHNYVHSRQIGLSLNELLLGRRSSHVPQNNGSEYPEWNFGDDFEDGNTPDTTAFTSATHPPSSACHVSSKETPTTAPHLFNLSTRNDHSSSIAQNNDFHQHGFTCSPLEQTEDVCNRNKSLQFLQQNRRHRFQSDAFNVSGTRFLESDIVQFSSIYTCGLHVNERVFRPLSLKHVRNDNVRTFSDLLDEYSMNIRDPSPQQFNSNELGQQNIFHPLGSSSSRPPIFANISSRRSIICSASEEELFSMLTNNIEKNSFSSCRAFQIEERWAAERTLALCMSDGGYINEYVMDAYVKMILFNQKMNESKGVKLGFLQHITYSEISESLMYHSLDHSLYKKLFSELGVGFRLEHAGLVHVPCAVTKQWFLIVANFMDKRFEILNPSQTSDALKPTIDAVIYNFKKLFLDSFPHCQNFNILDFKVRHVKVPKQNFKYDSGFFVLVFMLTFNGFEVPDFSNEDLPALKRKLLHKLISNYYNVANVSPRIKAFIKKHGYQYC